MNLGRQYLATSTMAVSYNAKGCGLETMVLVLVLTLMTENFGLVLGLDVYDLGLTLLVLG